MSVAGDLLLQDGEKLLADPGDAILLQAEIGLVVTPNPGIFQLDLGRSQQFTAVALSSDGSTMSASGLTWTAASGTITSAGLYTASANVAVDVVTVTDPSSGISATIDVFIVPIVAVIVTPARAVIAVGASKQFTVSVVWANGDTGAPAVAATWSALTNAISSSGLYAGTAAAIDTVTATVFGVSGSASIGVVNPPSISPSESALTFTAIDQTCVLEILETPAFSLFAISSSAPIVARVETTVLAGGATVFVVTAVSAGTALITIEDEAGQTIEITVTVSILAPEVTVAIASPNS